MLQHYTAIDTLTLPKIPSQGYGRRLRNRLPAILKLVEDIILEEIDRGKLVSGSRTALVEKRLQEQWGTNFNASTLLTDCGSNALWGALQGLNLPPGSEIIMPSLTFFSTANAVHNVVCFYENGHKKLSGEKLVIRFVDVDDTYTINPKAIKAAITANTRAIMPVHLNGLPADMTPIMELAKKHDLYVIEDSAQAHQAEYQDPKTKKWSYAGNIGHVGCFSFSPVKIIGGIGPDCGAVMISKSMAKNHPEYIGWLKSWFDVGRTFGRYTHGQLGQRARADEYSAREILEELDLLPLWIEKRISIAKRFDNAAKNSTLGAKTLKIPKGRKSIYFTYPVRFETKQLREEFEIRMKKLYIEIAPFYTLQHDQEQYRSGWFPHKTDPLDTSLSFVDKITTLPIYPELTEEEIQRIETVLAS